MLSISEGKRCPRTWEFREACVSTSSPNTWNKVFGFRELLFTSGAWRRAEGGESPLRDHSGLENWDLWGHLKMLPEALAGLCRGSRALKSDGLKFQSWLHCLLIARQGQFLFLFFLNNTSLRLSFFQLNEGNIFTPVYLWWELKMR